jgi:XTP/dITP diphosphohydrolase
MMDIRLFFASKNVGKLEDVMELVGAWSGIRIDHYEVAIEELQTSDLKALVQDKAIRAFSIIRQPLVVDHTCLELKALNGLPGTHARLFWDRLGDRICEVVGKLGEDKAEVTVGLAYTDGKSIKTVMRKQRGTIAPAPRGARHFDWDRLFVPDGESRTYAEMTPAEKNRTSPRARAFEAMARNLRAI